MDNPDLNQSTIMDDNGLNASQILHLALQKMDGIIASMTCT